MHLVSTIHTTDLNLLTTDLEHFHVMLYKASQDFLDKLTGGDRPMSVVIQE